MEITLINKPKMPGPLTLVSCWTKDLVELEQPAAIFSLFKGIHHNKLPILANVLYSRMLLIFARKKWPYTTIDSYVPYQKKKGIRLAKRHRTYTKKLC